MPALKRTSIRGMNVSNVNGHSDPFNIQAFYEALLMSILEMHLYLLSTTIFLVKKIESYDAFMTYHTVFPELCTMNY